MMLGFVSIGGDGVLGRFVRAKIATGTMLLLLWGVRRGCKPKLMGHDKLQQVVGWQDVN